MRDEDDAGSEPKTLDEAVELVNRLRGTIEHLETALKSRDRIGQAKGVLIERLKVSEEEAFELLVQVSQHKNRKLVEVADQLMYCGELPGVGDRWTGQKSDGAHPSGTA